MAGPNPLATLEMERMRAFAHGQSTTPMGGMSAGEVQSARAAALEQALRSGDIHALASMLGMSPMAGADLAGAQRNASSGQAPPPPKSHTKRRAVSPKESSSDDQKEKEAPGQDNDDDQGSEPPAPKPKVSRRMPKK